MNSCPHKENILLYLLGILTEKEKKMFEKHVDTCDYCQRELQIEKAIDGQLSESFEPGHLEDIVLKRVRLIRSFNFGTLSLSSVHALVYALVGLVFGFVGVSLWRFIPFHRMSSLAFTVPDFALPTIPGPLFLGIVVSLGFLLMIGSLIYSLRLNR